MARRVDYDRIARTYDRRYQQNDYSGVEAALIAFVGEHSTNVYSRLAAAPAIGFGPSAVVGFA